MPSSFAAAKRMSTASCELLTTSNGCLEGTEPAIELIELKHVNSQSMSEARDASQRTSARDSAWNGQHHAIGQAERLAADRASRRRGRHDGADPPIGPAGRTDLSVQHFSPQTLAGHRRRSNHQHVFQGRGGLGPRIQLQADFRTNSIIVYASPRDMEEVRQLLQEIDVADNAATSEVRVFKLNNALAEELAPVLEATLRGEAAPSARHRSGSATGRSRHDRQHFCCGLRRSP